MTKTGDFSDTASHHTYQVGNITDAVEAESRALETGGDPVWMDAKIDGSEYEIEQNQKFTIAEFELDSQGVSVSTEVRLNNARFF